VSQPVSTVVHTSASITSLHALERSESTQIVEPNKVRTLDEYEGLTLTRGGYGLPVRTVSANDPTLSLAEHAGTPTDFARASDDTLLISSPQTASGEIQHTYKSTENLAKLKASQLRGMSGSVAHVGVCSCCVRH
jgi:hypothetical protein